MKNIVITRTTKRANGRYFPEVLFTRNYFFGLLPIGFTRYVTHNEKGGYELSNLISDGVFFKSEIDAEKAMHQATKSWVEGHPFSVFTEDLEAVPSLW